MVSLLGATKQAPFAASRSPDPLAGYALNRRVGEVTLYGHMLAEPAEIALELFVGERSECERRTLVDKRAECRRTFARQFEPLEVQRQVVRNDGLLSLLWILLGETGLQDLGQLLVARRIIGTSPHCTAPWYS